MGLREAPTYWPNEKEWADPLAYIQSIADEGQKYGIVKVCAIATSMLFQMMLTYV